MLRREEPAEEIERLHSMDPSDISEENKFLLGFGIDDLAEGDITNQEQWIIAMRAARTAGVHAQGHRVRWTKLPKYRRRHRAPRSRVFVTQSNQEAVLQSAFSDLLPKDIKRPSEAVLSLLDPSNKRRKRRRKAIESVTS